MPDQTDIYTRLGMTAGETDEDITEAISQEITVHVDFTEAKADWDMGDTQQIIAAVRATAKTEGREQAANCHYRISADNYCAHKDATQSRCGKECPLVAGKE